MSTVLVVAPLVIGNWAAISAAITAAMGTLGFAFVHEAAHAARSAQRARSREEIDIENSEILQASAGTEQSLVVERDGVRAVFSRDARGALKLCMEGNNLTKAQLRSLGDELIGRVTQQFVYHRLVSELHERNMTIVDEQVAEDQSVRIRVRNW